MATLDFIAEMSSDIEEIDYGLALASVLRAVRELRHLRQLDVAKALGISHRTYQELEAGSGRLYVGQLLTFATITDSDQMALLAAVIRDAPNFAVRAADRKIMTIMMRLVDDLQATLGDDIAKLRPNDLVSNFRPRFIALAEEVSRRDADGLDPPNLR